MKDEYLDGIMAKNRFKNVDLGTEETLKRIVARNQSEQKYIIENMIDIEGEPNTYYDTITNLRRVIGTTWSQVPHRVVEYKDHDDPTLLTHIEVRKPEDQGEILHTFLLTRAESLPLLPDHL